MFKFRFRFVEQLLRSAQLLWGHVGIVLQYSIGLLDWFDGHFHAAHAGSQDVGWPRYPARGKRW
jgi:hypothetical protein